MNIQMLAEDIFLSSRVKIYLAKRAFNLQEKYLINADYINDRWITWNRREWIIGSMKEKSRENNGGGDSGQINRKNNSSIIYFYY